MERRSHVNVPVDTFYCPSQPSLHITASIKSCASDFMVHEVTLQDEVLGLTSLSKSVPQPPVNLPVATNSEPSDTKQTNSTHIPQSFDLSTVFSAAQLEVLDKINQSLGNTDSSLHLEVPFLVPKEERRHFYTTLKASYPLLSTSLQDTTLVIKVDTTLEPLLSYLPYADIARIAAYRQHPSPEPLLLPTALDRATRTTIIRTLSLLFPSFDYKTVGTEDLKRISIHWKKKSLQQQNHKRKSNQISSTSYHLHFTLCKCNVEQLAALSILANYLGLPSYAIATAGIKDKIAITYQRCSIAIASTPQYHEVVSKLVSFQHHSISVGDFAIVETPVTLGGLSGNYFRITLRNVTVTPPMSFDDVVAHVKSRLSQLAEVGCPNYFGSQRFGESRTASIDAESVSLGVDEVDAEDDLSIRNSAMPLGAVVGKYLMKQDYRAAMLAILCPDGASVVNASDSTSHKDNITIARKLIHDFFFNDATVLPVSDILKLLPQSMTRERCILKALQRYGTSASTSYKMAIESIPYSARQLYIHAYQSWLWNDVASYAIGADNGVEGALPMIGKQSELPENEIGKYYYELLLREGIVIDKNETRSNTSYTSLMKQNLCLDVLLPSGSTRSVMTRPTHVDVVENGENDSFTVCFRLQSGCYATALLRELLRNDDII